MKIFLSYKFTGEDPKDLEKTIGGICSSLEAVGHEVFCSFWKSNNGFFEKEGYSKRQILEYALKELDSSDCVLVFVMSEEKSEGMLLEIGYALANGKKMILAIKKGIKTTFIEELADEVIEFKDMEQLNSKLRKV